MDETRYDVIYVDDETTMTDIFDQFVKLKFNHWQARSFADSGALYALIERGEISAAVWVVDLMMPQRSGPEIAEALRRVYGSEPVILGYTALDSYTLATNPEYQYGMEYFTRIVNKQENFLGLLGQVNDLVVASKA